MLVLFVLGQRFFPPLIAQSLRESVIKSAVSIDTVDVSIRVIPFYKIFFGSVDHLEIEAADYTTDQIAIEKLNLSISNLRYNSSKLLFSKVFEVTGLGKGRGVFRVTEETLNDYFIRKLGNADLVNLELIGDRCYLKGNLRTAGIEFELALGGTFKVTGAHSVTYIPKEFSVQKTIVPESIISQLANQLDLTFDLGSLPVPYAVESVSIHDGGMTITMRLLPESLSRR